MRIECIMNNITIILKLIIKFKLKFLYAIHIQYIRYSIYT